MWAEIIEEFILYQTENGKTTENKIAYQKDCPNVVIDINFL